MFRQALEDTDTHAIAEFWRSSMTSVDPAWAGADLARVLRTFHGGVVAACSLAAGNLAHPLARSELDERVMYSLLHSTAEARRLSRLSKLARLRVPRMGGGDLGTLVTLRRSNESFALFRTHLGSALDQVAPINEDDEDAVIEASRIVSSELSDGLVAVQAEIRRSPAMQAIRGGLVGMGVTGVSAATTGALTGSPWIAAASGAAAKFTDASISYIKAKRAQRKGRLLLEVALMFHDE